MAKTELAVKEGLFGAFVHFLCVCVCVWVFGGMRVSAKLSIQVSKLKFILL